MGDDKRLILYHYTTLGYIKPDGKPGIVTAAGLQPLEPREDDPFPPLIWLTSERDSLIASPGDWFYRIEMVIPTTDRALRRAKDKFMSPNLREDFARRAKRTWWTYDKLLDPSHFRSIDAIRDSKPWWLIDVEEATSP